MKAPNVDVEIAVAVFGNVDITKALCDESLDVEPDDRSLLRDPVLTDSEQLADPFEKFFRAAQAETLAKSKSIWDVDVPVAKSAPASADLAKNSAARLAKAFARIDELFGSPDASEAQKENIAALKARVKEGLLAEQAEVLAA